MHDVAGLQRTVCGYSKLPNKNGEFLQQVEYLLKPLNLDFLQKLFNIDPNDPDPIQQDMVYCYDINEAQAKVLQPYVIDGIIDLEKYNFMLESYAEEE